jgi:Polyketide cyclase / dehydrase and lipid transport
MVTGSRSGRSSVQPGRRGPQAGTQLAAWLPSGGAAETPPVASVAVRPACGRPANRWVCGHEPASFDTDRSSPGAGMYLFECEATFEAEPAAVWTVWTDVARWPEWDVSKEIARLDGAFQPGACGWAKQRGNLGGSFTLTAVDAGRRWVTECPVPLGKVVFDHLLEPVAGGRVRVVKRAEVQGGFGPLLRLFAPKMRRDTAASLAALGRRLSA